MLPSVTVAANNTEWPGRHEVRFAMPDLGKALSGDSKCIIMDILRAIYEPEYLDVKHVAIPYPRAIKETRSGEFHMTLDIQPSKGLLSARTPIVPYDLSACYFRGRTEWKGLKSLKGQRVAYLYGFDLYTLLPVEFSRQIVYDLSSAFHLLDRGDIAFILDDHVLLKDAMSESGFSSHLFEISIIKHFKVTPQFSDTPEGRKYLAMYDRRMKELLQSGELTDIYLQAEFSNDEIEKLFDQK
jgi:polar amino acid transport system substrate-binding protein